MNYLEFISEQWILVSIILVLIYAFAFNEMRRGGDTVSIHQLTRLVNGDSALIIDLREKKEYSAGHITDAKHLAFAKLKDSLSELEAHKDKTIVLVDKMGQHTGSAGKLLQAQGYTVARLKGGMMEWQGQNLPLVNG